MDEQQVETDSPTVGERLRSAREEKGFSLDDIASQTRIPRRHLESLEQGAWDKLPAPTYTIGFAKAYASAVGLDRADVADQLRAEMGGERPSQPAEIFEPADPARTMPKWLVLVALVAVIAIALGLSWFNRRSLEQTEPVAAAGSATQDAVAVPSSATPAPAAPAPAAGGPVVITATEEVWLRIRDGSTTLKEGILQPGERFEVPAAAAAPTLTTGKPEALRVTVGPTLVPPLGPPATTVSNVSLLAGDLGRGAATSPGPGPAGQNTAG